MAKSTKKPKFFHTPNTSNGMGDYYGTGIKNPTGKIRSFMAEPLTTKIKAKRPKALA